jgi:hypothetical protein
MNKSFKDILNDLLTPEQKVALKAEFNALPTIPTPTPVAPAPVVSVFGEGKLMDGTPIKYDTEVLAVGSIVTVVTEAGELPAPDGEHELENGDKIYITGGKVDKIEPKVEEVVAPIVEEPMAAAPVNPLIDALKALMEGKFEAQNKEVSDLKNIVADQAKALEAFKSFFNSLVETPTGTPVVKGEAFLSKRKQTLVNKYFNK